MEVWEEQGGGGDRGKKGGWGICHAEAVEG